MSIKSISTLSTNPHFYAFLIQCFLTGYNKPCSIGMIYLALPVLLSSEAREKFLKANSKSTLDTVFEAKSIPGKGRLSGKSRLANYSQLYEMLRIPCGKAIVILSSEEKITVKEGYAYLNQVRNYKAINDSTKKWARIAHYLGVVFSKSSRTDIFFYLGAEKA